eukprot:scaffold93330_cov57-Phaeocystis_antarctica.AAC.3
MRQAVRQGGQAGRQHTTAEAHTHRMVLQRHLAVGFLDDVQIELRRKSQPERGIETVVSTGIHGGRAPRRLVGGLRRQALGQPTSPSLRASQGVKIGRYSLATKEGTIIRVC